MTLLQSAHRSARRRRRPHAISEARLLDRLIGAVLVVHGIAHFVGTSEAYGAIGDDTGAVTYLFDHWTLTAAGELAVAGTIWAIAGVAFIAAGLGAAGGRSWWRRSALAVAGASLVLCVIGLWPAWIGVIVNTALIALLARTSRSGGASQ